MRMRLRAPDEPEAESGHDFGDANSSAPSTPERRHLLPPLDVGSPEYIEERLENLKRRPNWGDFLDQYVKDHPDSDSESEAGDFDSVSTTKVPGLIRSTLWSLLVVALAPLLILCSTCLRHKGYGFWPLGCRSMKELFGCALANVIFMTFGLVLLYWAICRELPDVFNVNNTLVKLNVQIDELQHAADTCQAALMQWERAVAQELCMPVGIDVVLLLLNAWLLLHCHRRWARYLMVLMAVVFVVDVPTQLYDATFPAPEMHKVDPTFAMVDEELLVALDGKNLKPGGSVAWVAYWGCATTSNVDTCDKQFSSTFEAGNVAVTFKSLDHFIPCYRDPPNPLKAQDYQCFEDVRIRVKDMQSIPGWSRTSPQAASVSHDAKAETPLNEEWPDNLDASFFEREERMGHEVIKPTHRIARSAEPIEAVDIDISVSTRASSESLSTASNGESGLKKEVAELSGEGNAQDNESLARSSAEAEPEAAKAEANIADEKLKEVEVMSDADVKLLHINTEVENASQSEETLSSMERSEEPATEMEELQVSRDTVVEAEVDKTNDQEEEMSVGKVAEPELTKGDMQLDVDALVSEYVRIIDDEIELGAMAVILKEEDVQVAPDNHEERESEAEEKRDVETSTYEAQSEELSMTTFVTEEVKKSQDSSTPIDATGQVKDTQSRPSEATKDGAQPEDVRKKRKSSKRKDRRSGKTKKGSKPAIVDTAEDSAAAA